MKNWTIDISLKDGRVRHYEGPALRVLASTNGVLVVDDHRDMDDILDSVEQNDIYEMTIHLTNKDDNS